MNGAQVANVAAVDVPAIHVDDDLVNLTHVAGGIDDEPISLL
jgi:hypothetical protein